MRRPILLALLLALLLACGGKPPPAAPIETSQPLDQATSLLCAAPRRAEADKDYAGDGASKAAVLAKHMKDGVHNARVLAAIDGWSADKPTEQKLAELDGLTSDAHFASKCQLRELWTSPPA